MMQGHIVQFLFFCSGSVISCFGFQNILRPIRITLKIHKQNTKTKQFLTECTCLKTYKVYFFYYYFFKVFKINISHGTCVPQHAAPCYHSLFSMVEEGYSRESHDMLDFTLSNSFPKEYSCKGLGVKC